jgi:ferredoxin-NADP reductase
MTSGSKRASMIHRYCVILNVVLFFVIINAHAQQQTEDSEHASHHPEAANGPSVAVSTDSPPLANQVKGQPGNANAMMGPGMAKGMDKMMEKMGAPKPKDLYPTLMRMQSTTPEQRDSILGKASARMQQGSEQLTTGFESLARAAAVDDYTQMQVAVETVKEGIAHFDSGLAAKRAIQDGQEPRRVALTWFKSQMNLLPSSPVNDSSTLFGMTPFHSAVMLVLLIFTVVMVYVYGFKMRRAAALLEELRSTETASASAPTKHTSPNEIPTNAPVGTDTVLIPATAQALSSTTMSPRKGVHSGSMQVTGIFHETHDVKTFRLASADGQVIPFSFEPGQFVTFTLTIDGVEKPVKRSYTIASSPTEQYYFEVTIKREEFGVVSRHMHDVVNVGDTLSIKAPGGKFYFNGPDASSVVLISGGVGITPMMSAVRYLTTTCWDGDIYFLFCTRTSNDFIFEQELKYLQARHPRLKVLVSMTQADGTSWMGPQGRFSSALINEFVPDIALKTAHICGPPAMMDATKDILSELGMPEANIKTEAFGGASPKKTATKTEVAPNTPVNNTRQVRFSLSNAQAQAGTDETVLDVADGLDVDIENSCRAGSCGSCKVKLLRGDVDMEVDDGLEPEDRVSGYILACQAIPKTDVEVEA